MMLSSKLSISSRRGGIQSVRSYFCNRPLFFPRVFQSTSLNHEDENNHETSQCNLNIVSSPYPDIRDPPYEPVTEFVTSGWRQSDSGQIRRRTAILDGSTGESRTFQDFHHDMGKIAEALKTYLNVNDHSTVVFLSPNHVDYIPISLAVSLCGAKLSPVNPVLKYNEVQVILEKSHSDVLIFHSSLVDVALKAAKDCPTIRHLVVIPANEDEEIPPGCISLNTLKNHDHEGLYKSVDSAIGDLASHPYLLPYSSGTTGMPKGVCLSHNNIVANLLQCDVVEGICMSSDEKVISPLPFFHIYGFLFTALYWAWKGQEVITMSQRFDLELFCQLVETHKPQRAHLVPPIILGLAKSPIVDKYDLSSLKMIVSAAAPLSRETEEAVTNRIGCSIKQAWGMSELSPIGTLNSDYNFKSGSVGPVVSNTHAKILDPETGASRGPNEEGELVIKGPQVMMGYLDDPDKTAECLTQDGWLKTGDIAYYDDDGFLYISDRLKELIKVRGYPVAPAELEALLLTHPDIVDAAVIPVPDESSGELPRAYVVLRPNIESDKESLEENIQMWVKEKVAPFKQLKGGVKFVGQVPKSASGKILRRLLVDEARKEMASSSN